MARTAITEVEPTLTPDTPDAAELVELAAAGDDEAFRQLVRRVLPRLRRWALARTGDPDDADEVVQQTLIRMHGSLDGFRAASRLSTWLYRILANAAVDLQRSRGSRPTVSTERLTHEPDADAGADPIGSVHARRMADAVRSYFGGLPERQREILMLVDHEGMRPVDVAEALEMKPVTVRAHLFKARRKVREEMIQRYPELSEGYRR